MVTLGCRGEARGEGLSQNAQRSRKGAYRLGRRDQAVMVVLEETVAVRVHCKAEPAVGGSEPASAIHEAAVHALALVQKGPPNKCSLLQKNKIRHELTTNTRMNDRAEEQTYTTVDGIN